MRDATALSITAIRDENTAGTVDLVVGAVVVEAVVVEGAAGATTAREVELEVVTVDDGATVTTAASLASRDWFANASN